MKIKDLSWTAYIGIGNINPTAEQIRAMPKRERTKMKTCELCNQERETKPYQDKDLNEINHYCEECAEDMGYPYTLERLDDEN